MTSHNAPDEKLLRERNLLVIDDEPDVTQSLRRQFRRDYSVHLAGSAQEGFEIMARVPIQVIISDQRMPGMSGSEFFDRAKHDYPDAIRLLLTGYADLDAVIQAINDGNIFRYITKPWDPAELDTIVDQAFVHHDLIMENRLLIERLRVANQTLEERVEERTRELREANAQLEQVNKVKDRVLGVVAHDLRGPLGSSRMCMELARETEEAEERDELLRETTETIGKMQDLVNDLLDSTVIDSGKLVLNREATDVREFLDRVRRLNQRFVDQKKLRLRIEIEEGLRSVKIDARRMEQVLDNLLNNACKFSPGGTTITLAVRGEGDETVFSVADEGPGISKEEQETIFHEFAQTRVRATGGEKGLGLGLAICKKIVELHGGRISLRSEPGEGTVFLVRIPREG